MPLVLGVDSSTQATKIEVRDADTGALVGEGRAPHPVYLSIYDDVVQVRDARGLWGKGTCDTEDSIRRRLELYASSTEPLIAWYLERHKLAAADGMGPPERVTARLIRAIDNRRHRPPIRGGWEKKASNPPQPRMARPR